MSQGQNDLQNLTSTIAQKMSEGAQKTKTLFSSAFIYRVPKDLRKVNKSAYTPRLIAIGPLHRKDNHLQTPMQHVKMSYMNDLLSRVTAIMELAEQTKITLLQKCLEEMKTSIDDAKKYYAAEVTLDAEMMLVDGCFILEFLYKYRTFLSLGLEIETEPIFGNSLTFRDVRNDLVLLENQMPFFVLEKLFRLTVGQIRDRHDKSWSLTHYVRCCYRGKMSPTQFSNDSSSTKTRCSPRDCILWIFGDKWVKSTTKEGEKEEEGEEKSNANYYHILHNLHDCYLAHVQTKQRTPISVENLALPSASELKYSGVKFVPDTGDNLFKFEFSEPKGLFWRCRRACFVIPPLALEDSTELYLRNLIAFEQCCPGVSQHVLSYAIVMDMLVNTDKDIQVLEKAKVMRNFLGAREDATALFNKLCKETVIFDLIFANTCKKATRYSECFWPRNMAHVRRTYLASPWKFIAFCVGFIAFVITVVDFVRSFIKKEKGGCGCQGTKRSWG